MASERKNDTYSFGGCELALSRRELRRNGEALSIAPQVFEFLRILIENRDRVVKKEELNERIWDGRAISDSSFSTCVKLARKAVGDDGKRQDFIRTVPRRGYRFVGTIEPRSKVADIEIANDPVTEPLYNLKDKPSIAVLAFDNLSAEEDHFADGMTETIISALSTVPKLFVIARNSSFVYKGKQVNVQQVAIDLGVKYIVEGSVQKSCDRLRVTAQLIDAVNGYHLWADRYDRDVSDIFTIQDDITLQIVTALRVELTDGEAARLRNSRAKNLRAWSCVIQGQHLYQRFSRTTNVEARNLFQEAVSLDQNYLAAWNFLGWTHFVDARFGYSSSFDQSLKLAKNAAEKALEIEAENTFPHALLCGIFFLEGEFDKAISEGRYAIKLAPSVAPNYPVLSIPVFYAGNFREAISLSKEAMRLSPPQPAWYLSRLGAAHMMLGEYDEAIAAFKATEGSDFALVSQFAYLPATYSMMGRMVEACDEVAKLLADNPTFTLKDAAKGHFFKDPKHLDRIIDALRAAGVPE